MNKLFKGFMDQGGDQNDQKQSRIPKPSNTQQIVEVKKATGPQKRDSAFTLPRNDEEYAAFERVKVIVRVRPALHADEVGGVLHVEQKDPKKITVLRSNDQGVLESNFDRVFGSDESQHSVYEESVRPIVEDVCRGYNGTIMAYGQTGAGKTYTLTSIEPDSIGMMPRAANEIFNDIAHDQLNECTVYMSYIQIYMEIVKDLLKPSSNNLSIREDTNGVYLAGVQEVQVSSTEDCLKLLQVGEQNRVYAFTNMNAQSSRSHVCVQLTVVKKRRELGERALFANGVVLKNGEVEQQQEFVAQQVKVGRLFIVDLAGSERLKKSRSTGVRATEAKSINLSLTVLGMCINARADPNSTHVPFRDSKLTRLLQESLGGNAKTCMIVNVADVRLHIEETLQSLSFGQRAMTLRNKPVVNSHVDYKAINDELAQQLDVSQENQQTLEKQLQKKQEQVDTLTTQVRKEQAKFGAILDNLRREKEDKESAAKKALQDREKKLAEHTKQLQYAQSKLQSNTVELESYRKKLALTEQQSKRELERLTKENKALTEQVKEANKTAIEAKQHLDMEVERLKTEISKADQAKREVETTMKERHRAELAKYKAEREEEEARTRQTQLDEMKAKEAKLKKEFNDDRRLLVGQHNAQVNDLEEQLQDAVARLQASVEETYTWQARVQEVQEDMEESTRHLKSRVKELEGTLQEAMEQISSLQHENLSLTRDVASLEADRHKLRGELDSSESKSAVLSREVVVHEQARKEALSVQTAARREREAALSIQKYWRRWQLRETRAALLEANTNAQIAQKQTAALQQQVQALDARENETLAWTGAQLVQESLGHLVAGMECLQNNFIAPKKDVSYPSQAAPVKNQNQSLAFALASRATFGESFSKDIDSSSRRTYMLSKGSSTTMFGDVHGTPSSSHIGTAASGNGSGDRILGSSRYGSNIVPNRL